jgi:hypothetical protein
MVVPQVDHDVGRRSVHDGTTMNDGSAANDDSEMFAA